MALEIQVQTRLKIKKTLIISIFNSFCKPIFCSCKWSVEYIRWRMLWHRLGKLQRLQKQHYYGHNAWHTVLIENQLHNPLRWHCQENGLHGSRCQLSWHKCRTAYAAFIFNVELRWFRARGQSCATCISESQAVRRWYIIGRHTTRKLSDKKQSKWKCVLCHDCISKLELQNNAFWTWKVLKPDN